MPFFKSKAFNWNDSEDLLNISINFSSVSKDIMAKVVEVIKKKSESLNPLVYHANLENEILNIRINTNSNFDTSTMINIPHVINNTVSEDLLKQLKSRIISFEKFEPEAKKNCISKIDEVINSMACFQSLVKKYYNTSEFYKLTHNDLNNNNVLVKDNKVFLKDFDTVGLSYSFCDLAYFMKSIKYKLDPVTYAFLGVNDVKKLYKQFKEKFASKATDEEFIDLLDFGMMFNSICQGVMMMDVSLQREDGTVIIFFIKLVDEYLNELKKIKSK